ncbi:unnamed protein product [Prorocentrum cordatum]|uniref:Uncharacterized protein n=1 Tax=Prorocentrum cordatum TaxID=2364126 RepID=A0ABN9WYP8_9DINO|nr:unnamed protein product [Polarella glacialis]
MGSERMGRRIAPHRRRRRGRNRAPHRAASPQHRQRGAIFRPFLLGPHLGGWNYFGVALAHVRASPGQSSLAGSGSCRILQDLALWLTTFTLTPASHGSTWAAPDPPLWPHPPSSHRPARGAPSGCRRGLRAGGPGGGQRRHARARNGARRRPSPSAPARQIYPRALAERRCACVRGTGTPPGHLPSAGGRSERPRGEAHAHGPEKVVLHQRASRMRRRAEVLVREGRPPDLVAGADGVTEPLPGPSALGLVPEVGVPPLTLVRHAPLEEVVGRHAMIGELLLGHGVRISR